MNILFTICARANSTGLPHKNERMFLDIPLLYYTLAVIDLYRKKHSENNIIVALNTDSDILLQQANNQNHLPIISVERKIELAKNIIPKMAVIKDTFIVIQQKNQKKLDMVIDLDLTSPLRSVNNVEDAIDDLTNYAFDVVFSVTHSRRNPYFNMVQENNRQVMLVKNETFYSTRQAVPVVYDMNASIYAYCPMFLQSNQSNRIFDGNCGCIHMLDTAILDIDDAQDFALLELVAPYFYQTNNDLMMVAKHAEQFGC